MIETFLTAYDPSDLPGTSIDPLGFERGYLLLADKILPGLTNVASRPRYFALLCAGIHLNRETADTSPQELVRRRQRSILRLERFWALANVLARPDSSGGVRGVTYARARVDEIKRRGDKRTNADFTLLSRQIQYGAIGMYANVADGMRFLNRDDLALTPALGEIAAGAFFDETAMPAALRSALLDDSDETDLSVATLADWGERAHVEAEVGRTEAQCLLDATHFNPVRSRMVHLLKRHPSKNNQDTELRRLDRVAKSLNGADEHQDIRQAIECILAFESCYRLTVLALERILWLCRNHAASYVSICDLDGDLVLKLVREKLNSQVARFVDTLNNATHPDFRQNLDRVSDVRMFLEEARNAVDDIEPFVGTIMRRHADVQHGKFDRGRRKMPWLERADSKLFLTMTRAGGLTSEARVPDDIAPHPYRLRAADALISAFNKATQC